jgi:hypothetical protein
MRKTLLVITLLLLTMISVAQVPKPGKPAFIVTYEESGKFTDVSWHYNATVKFSLSASSGWFYVNESGIPDFTKLIDFDPARFLKLDPGSIIGFYPSEVDESGSGDAANAASYTRVLTPDGTETVVENTSEGTKTIITTEADVRRRFGMTTDGPAYNLNARSYQINGLAELERTETGAILRAYTSVGNNLSDWAVSQETMEQVFPKVQTFVLTDQDIKAWQQISRTNVASGSGEDEHLTVKLSVKMTVSATAEATLEGCSEFGEGEIGTVTASGDPDGGTYEFRVEPSDLMSVDANGASAELTGSRPGRGTLYVEYTAPDGATAEASKPASMVRINDYNGGEAIPQIPLYDINGKKMSGNLTIPYSSEPDEAYELVDFVSGNPSIFSVAASADNLDLQGLKPGKATLEAKDNCGNTTGPTVEVEVVNCNDETIARLEKQRQAATENLQIATKELQSIAGSKEFEKARDDLVGSTIDLLAKVGLTIISGGKTTGAVKTAAEIADVGAGLSDMLASGSHEEFFVNGVKAAAGKIWGETVSTLIGLTEVAQAADRFYENIGEIKLHENALKSALESYEKALKALEDVVRRQEICKGDKTQPQQQEKPKTDQTPEPTKPAPPKEPEPKTDTPPSKELPPEEPTTPEPGDEEPPVPPTTPTGETRQVGLPYSPEECDCEESKSIGLSSAGFSALQAGIKNLGDCVEKFNSISVTDYSSTLKELAALADTLKAAADEDPAIFGVKAKEAKPQLDSLIERTKSYDEAGKTFLKQFEKCPESVSAGMDVLKSAMTVTVDSIKTKY